jgi:hypothetical protein
MSNIFVIFLNEWSIILHHFRMSQPFIKSILCLLLSLLLCITANIYRICCSSFMYWLLKMFEDYWLIAHFVIEMPFYVASCIYFAILSWRVCTCCSVKEGERGAIKCCWYFMESSRSEDLSSFQNAWNICPALLLLRPHTCCFLPFQEGRSDSSHWYFN